MIRKIRLEYIRLCQETDDPRFKIPLLLAVQAVEKADRRFKELKGEWPYRPLS